jgi:formate-dependent nitrite reductase cytochrome c552 subunit
MSGAANDVSCVSCFMTNVQGWEQRYAVMKCLLLLLYDQKIACSDHVTSS